MGPPPPSRHVTPRVMASRIIDFDKKPAATSGGAPPLAARGSARILFSRRLAATPAAQKKTCSPRGLLHPLFSPAKSMISHGETGWPRCAENRTTLPQPRNPRRLPQPRKVTPAAGQPAGIYEARAAGVDLRGRRPALLRRRGAREALQKTGKGGFLRHFTVRARTVKWRRFRGRRAPPPKWRDMA